MKPAVRRVVRSPIGTVYRVLHVPCPFVASKRPSLLHCCKNPKLVPPRSRVSTAETDLAMCKTHSQPCGWPEPAFRAHSIDVKVIAFSLEGPLRPRVLWSRADYCAPTSITPLKTGEHSDLIILCNGHKFKAHRNIVCPRSRFFEAACHGSFSVS